MRSVSQGLLLNNVEKMFKLYDGNSRKYSLWLSNRLFNRSEQVGEKDTSVIRVFVWSEFMFFLLTPLFFVIFLIIVLRAISVVVDARALASTQHLLLRIPINRALV